MADMAALSQVEAAWERLAEAGVAERTVPVTYMNSSADIKGFVGRRGGVVCTSSNARRAIEWALERPVNPGAAGARKVLFLPDQHIWGGTPRSWKWACRWRTACSTTRTSRAAG